MSTVLLLGTPSPALTTVASILATLGCRVLRGVEGTGHQEYVQLDLAMVEYHPQEMSPPRFWALLESLEPVPTLVVGPELSALQIESLLSRRRINDYLRINTSPSEKLEAIRARLPQTTRNVLTVGELQLNIQDGAVRYGTRTMHLTSTEFRLLQSLMREPGHKIGCQALEELAGCNDAPAHLSSVRRKLSACSAAPMLRGNRSQGYAIDARYQPRLPKNAVFALRTHLTGLI